MGQLILLLAQSEPAPAPAGPDAGQVTQAWMAGVVGIMLIFGVIALIGYVRKKFVSGKAG